MHTLSYSVLQSLSHTLTCRCHLNVSIALPTNIILLTMGCRFLTKFIKLDCVPYTNGYFVRILLSNGKNTYTHQMKRTKRFIVKGNSLNTKCNFHLPFQFILILSLPYSRLCSLFPPFSLQLFFL